MTARYDLTVKAQILSFNVLCCSISPPRGTINSSVSECCCLVETKERDLMNHDASGAELRALQQSNVGLPMHFASFRFVRAGVFMQLVLRLFISASLSEF